MNAKRKIVIAGGTGFVGSYLADQFRTAGCEVIIVSRNPAHVSWDDSLALQEAVNSADMVINLAGKTVNCRYNKKNKKLILDSRIGTTRKLGKAISIAANPPPLWLNASTATIYRDEKQRANVESDGALGEGFSVEISKQWEEAFYSFKLNTTRQVALRISIVLGRGGGVFPIYTQLTKFGLGGAQGSGKQMFSWIHIEDLYRIISFIESHTDIEGAVNCASPGPIINDELVRAFRKVMHKKIGLPAPEWLLNMGAVLIGTEPELILKSRWVLPQKMTNAGFEFKYPKIEMALNNLINESK